MFNKEKRMRTIFSQILYKNRYPRTNSWFIYNDEYILFLANPNISNISVILLDL